MAFQTSTFLVKMLMLVCSVVLVSSRLEPISLLPPRSSADQFLVEKPDDDTPPQCALFPFEYVHQCAYEFYNSNYGYPPIYFFFTGTQPTVPPICCKFSYDLNHNCWIKLFPGYPELPIYLTRYCKSLGDKPPVAEDKPPVVGDKPPVVGGYGGVGGYGDKPPVAGDKPPVGGDKPPVVGGYGGVGGYGDKPPVAGDKPPVGGDKPPVVGGYGGVGGYGAKTLED